ncbi:HPCAL1 [Symbiodinium sp. CCMP2592]|nr:HPCAL1 [Symbiodinium sp. CCMP2592]
MEQGSPWLRLRSGQVLGRAELPRVVWSFWDKGIQDLSEFRQLCIETWRSMNPAWDIKVLDLKSVWVYLHPHDLPREWQDMYVTFQSDAVRLALLGRYGGIWVDPATICLRPFDTWLCKSLHRGPRGIAAFYFASWGTEVGRSTEYVENWVLAARRSHPMILRWKELFNSYFDSIRAGQGSLDVLHLPVHPMFRHIDLSHMQRYGHDMRSYLVMHSCFKKMIDEEPSMRRIWQEEMELFRADDHALWHMDEPEVCWDTEAALAKWLGEGNAAWEDHVLAKCPILKFTRTFAQLLDKEPRCRFVAPADKRPGHLEACCCLGVAFRSALTFEPAD